MWLHLLEKGLLVYTSEPLCAFRKHALQRTEWNKPSLVHKDEQIRLALDYCGSPRLKGYDVRNIQFLRLYDSRKFGKRGGQITPSRPLLMERLGRFTYCAYWLRRKVMNPFWNLSRALKRGDRR
jgi:hypothetical protein